ncbi:MAG: hypothetical protein RLZZ256_1024 [Bacteroidota bacterium]
MFCLPAGEVLVSGPGTPVDLNKDIGMQAVAYRTGIANFFEQLDGFRVDGLKLRRDLKCQLDAFDTAWSSSHDLVHRGVDSVQVEPHGSGLDAHDRQHTTGQAGGCQIGGGESLAQSIIVGWCIGFHGRPAGQVRANCSKFAFVLNRRCHELVLV